MNNHTHTNPTQGSAQLDSLREIAGAESNTVSNTASDDVHEDAQEVSHIPDSPIADGVGFKQVEVKNRFGVRENVYYQPAKRQAAVTRCNYMHWISSEEEPYTRFFQVRQEWKPIDCGWVEQCALLLLRNDCEQTLSHSPDGEELEQWYSQCIRVGVMPPAQPPKQGRTMHDAPATSIEPIIIATLAPQQGLRLPNCDAHRLVVQLTGSTPIRAMLQLFPH